MISALRSLSSIPDLEEVTVERPEWGLSSLEFQGLRKCEGSVRLNVCLAAPEGAETVGLDVLLEIRCSGARTAALPGYRRLFRALGQTYVWLGWAAVLPKAAAFSSGV